MLRVKYGSLEKKWEVYAIKYAERNDRTRNDSFIFDDHAHEQHSIDYFIWVLKINDQIVLVDTGYDQEEAKEEIDQLLDLLQKQLEILVLIQKKFQM